MKNFIHGRINNIIINVTYYFVTPTRERYVCNNFGKLFFLA